MKNNRSLILVIIVGIFLAVAALLVAFTINNTNFLTFWISDEEIQENNFNTDVKGGYNALNNLITKDLIVNEELREGVFAQDRTLNLPEGFEIELFAANMTTPRFLEFNGDIIYVTDREEGVVWQLEDTDKNGVADVQFTIDSGLTNPHGIEMYGEDLYVAEEDQVVAYRSIQADGTYSDKDTVIDGLPTGGAHVTRTIQIHNDTIYLTIGSSCNVCEEENPLRAAMYTYDLDGNNQQLYAEGLRNTVGFIFDDEDRIWSVDNGRDLIGDDLPPEEVNIIEEGKHYGWPYCYGNGETNPEYSDRYDFCENDTTYPEYNMQAHSAPLGLDIVEGVDFLPDGLQENLLIAFRGSWNRTIPTGYKIVRIDTESENAKTINFITGWLQQNGNDWGRPVDVKVGLDEALYITDDKAGAVYRVTYKN